MTAAKSSSSDVAKRSRIECGSKASDSDTSQQGRSGNRVKLTSHQKKCNTQLKIGVRNNPMHTLQSLWSTKVPVEVPSPTLIMTDKKQNR